MDDELTPSLRQEGVKYAAESWISVGINRATFLKQNTNLPALWIVRDKIVENRIESERLNRSV